MANKNLGQTVKQQILVTLQALQTAGTIMTLTAVDANPNPFTMVPDKGYPQAIVAMPRVDSEFQDSATNMRTYRFDVLVIMDPATMSDPTAAEGIMDAILNAFDSAFTLNLSAVAAVLPITVESFPVSTGDKQYLCFVATIRARTLYSI